jgi:hypothetical protein
MRTEPNPHGQHGPRGDLSESNATALIAQHSVLALALCAMLFVLCFPAEAQPPSKIPRIGYVSGTGSASNPGPYVEALRQGLRDLGYVEGKNFEIEFRGAEGKGGAKLRRWSPISYNSRSMFSCSHLRRPFSLPDKRPRKSPSSW